MSVFIFQTRQDQFDLRSGIEAGQEDSWYATRYRNDMQVDDYVYFWMAGDPAIRGLYGWGRVTKAPYQEAGEDTYFVDVVYRVRFAKPILAVTLKEHGLEELSIIKQPAATNFLLAADEVRKLAALVGSRGEEAPPGGEV
jgi:hypothetical protein